MRKITYSAKPFDTIEELTLSKFNFGVGDIVDLQGYYTAGDGAHHKRKVESIDDGSGVQLSNGLWANIVHNGEVNVSWFGAKGDGVTDDHECINKALTTANVRTIVLSDSSTYICNSMLQLSAKKIKLGTRATLKKTEGTQPIIWANGNNFAIEGSGLNSLITSTVPLEFGVVCVGNLGLDSTARNVLYGNIRHLEFSTPNTQSDTCTISFVGPQYSGTANYFHHMDDVKITGGDAGLLMYGWCNGNNFSNLHLYNNKTKGIYFKAIDNKVPLDNNITNVFHHTSVDATTLYMEGGMTNIVQGMNCEQGGDKAKSIHMTKECNNNTFIISSNTKGYRTILGENTVIDNFGVSSIKGLKLNEGSSQVINGIKNMGVQTTKSKVVVSGATERSLAEGKKYKVAEFYVGRTHHAGSSSAVLQHIMKVEIVINRTGGIRDRVSSSVYKVKTGVTNSIDILSNVGDFNIIPTISGNTVSIYCHTSNNGTSSLARANVTIELTTEHVDVGQPLADYLTMFDEEVTDVVSFAVGSTSLLSEINMLDTPYYTAKMQQEGIYEDFIAYMDEQHEYERLQRELEEQRQLAFENREDKNQSYEDWLSTQPQLMPFAEPQASQALLDFKKKYLG